MHISDIKKETDRRFVHQVHLESRMRFPYLASSFCLREREVSDCLTVLLQLVRDHRQVQLHAEGVEKSAAQPVPIKPFQFNSPFGVFQCVGFDSLLTKNCL